MTTPCGLQAVPPPCRFGRSTVSRSLAALVFSLTVFTCGTDKDGTAKPSSSSQSDLKVMTWNIAGRISDKEKILAVIKAQNERDSPLDVIALQEVPVDEAIFFAQELNFKVHFVQTNYNRKIKPEFGIAILSRHTFGGSQQWYRVDEGDAKCRADDKPPGPIKRKLASVTIRVKGRLVHIYTTHLTSHCGRKNEDSPKRTAQARIVRQRITDEFNKASEKFRPILLGDLNTVPGTSPYNVFVHHNFRDAWKALHPWDPGYTYKKERIRIDYIFVGKGCWKAFKIDQIRVHENNASDHYPVIARLSFD